MQTAPSASDVSTTDTEAARKAQDLSPIRQAMQQVEQILQSLQEVLDDMEHVLKVLHEAERQKRVDEQEIESLRQKLNKLQRGQAQ